ncbi:tail fiber domain-containing protein [Aquimarina sp. 2201CG1-2-11]|uniref:tail fiber domain-containing protein n=1 Tax=Aquimarina discodermiae TaxID=3231043 RepID=UPI0034617E50
MAIKSKNTLKTYFETADIPTEQQFADLIDSFWHFTDDGVSIQSFTTDPSGNIVITLSDERIITIKQLRPNIDYIAKTGGDFTGRVQVINRKDFTGVYMGTDGEFNTSHKNPFGTYKGFSVTPFNDGSGRINYQFRGVPKENGSGDQLLQLGVYQDTKTIKNEVSSMQMFQPNSLFVIGGWLGAHGTSEGYKEGDKFRVINGNAEIDGELRVKSIRSSGPILENGVPLATQPWVNNLFVGTGPNTKAKDSDKLDGIDSTGFVRKGIDANQAWNGQYLIFNYTDAGNVDAISYNDTDNSFHFNADTAKTNTAANANVNAGEFRIKNINTRLRKGTNNSLQIKTNHGYVDIGPQNTSHVHFQTDRKSFYFDKKILVNGDIGIYNKDTYMRKSDGAIFENGVRVATQNWVNNLFIGTGSNTKAKDSDKLDGIDSTGFARQYAIPSKTVNKGWYTIAINPGNRASAMFVLRDTKSSNHQTVHFYASHHYGNGNVINVLSNSKYSNGGTIRYVRIKENSTYDGAMLQVYIDADTSPVSGWILENYQISGWIARNWILDGTDPTGLPDFAKLTNIAVQIDLDKTQGILSSEEMFVKNNRVYHEGFKPTAAAVGALAVNAKATDSDKLDGLDSSAFIRSNANDTFTGVLSVGSTNSRQAGIYGIYDSKKTSHIWSIGTAYKIAANGSNFGNLYGFGYKHTNNATGGTMAGGHQVVWCENGNPRAALGSNIWTAGDIYANGNYYFGDGKRIIQFSDGWLRINPANNFGSGIYCGTGILRTDGQFQVGPNGNRFKVDSRGNTIASGNVTAYSDIRLKTDIQPIRENFLNKIDQLTPSYYKWKDESKDQTEQLGFIAQEVKEVFPEWVHQSNEHYAMSYDKMGAVLAVKGVQELHAEVKTLKEEIKELRSLIKELKNGITN